MEKTTGNSNTFLFNEIIFGPIQSRRLGVSLGVNLMPQHCKLCNFDCLYCECGWSNQQAKEHKLPDRLQVHEALTEKLTKMMANNKQPDYITFAGNGEPTIHPEFPEIIEDTLRLRNKLMPKAQISVLSNATMLHNPKIFAALQKVDKNIQKLDSAIDETFQLINKPRGKVKVSDIVQKLAECNNVTVQTLFLRGTYNGTVFNNATEKEIIAWIQALKQIQPVEVMVYTYSRSTPHDQLEPLTPDELQTIAKTAEQEGFNVSYTA